MGQEDARDRLNAVYEDFAKSVRRSEAIFGWFIILGVIAGIAVGAKTSWLVGVIVGIPVVSLSGYALSRLKARQKTRAKERFSELEEVLELSRKQTFEMLLSACADDKAAQLQLELFVTDLWGLDATTIFDSTRREIIERSTVSCPKCGSTALLSEQPSTSGIRKAAGWVAGAAVGAMVGSALGVGQVAGEALTYAGAKAGSMASESNIRCTKCGHKWKVELRNEQQSLPCSRCGKPILPVIARLTAGMCTECSNAQRTERPSG